MMLLLGLTKESTEEEIKKMVFQKISEVRWMSFSTNGLDGLPANRIFDFTKLDDGNIYFVTGKGKPVYHELEACPVASITAFFEDRLMLRVRVHVEQTDDPQLWEEFYSYNQGTKSLYRKSPGTLKLFRFTKGEGELMDLVKDDALARVRFGWGGEKKREPVYKVNDNCTSCGICQTVCTPGAMKKSGDTYYINDFYCLECGACYFACQDKAIDCLMDLHPTQKR